MRSPAGRARHEIVERERIIRGGWIQSCHFGGVLMECDGTTSLWLGVKSAPSRRPRIGRQGDPWPADQRFRPPSQSCVVPQHSKGEPVAACRVISGRDYTGSVTHAPGRKCYPWTGTNISLPADPGSLLPRNPGLRDGVPLGQGSRASPVTPDFRPGSDSRGG